MPYIVPFFLFVLGLCVGSFVNVLVFRFGFTERSSPRSHCRACEASLPWYDLLPIISFIMLSAKCRFCGSKLSSQYPLVEGSVGILFALSYCALPPLPSLWSLIAFVALLLFQATFVAIVVYDLRHTLVPMPFVYALIAFALLASIAQSVYASSFAPLMDAASGAATLFAFFMLIVLGTRGKGMGEADPFIAGAIGILFGFSRGIEAVMLGIWIGTVILFLMVLSSFAMRSRLLGKTLHDTMKTEVPLAPFLFVGTVVALFTPLSPFAWAAAFSNYFFAPYL